jgi:hypothetical protein
VSKLSRPRRTAGTPAPVLHGRYDFRGYVALRQIPCRACRNGSISTERLIRRHVGFAPESERKNGLCLRPCGCALSDRSNRANAGLGMTENRVSLVCRSQTGVPASERHAADRHVDVDETVAPRSARRGHRWRMFAVATGLRASWDCAQTAFTTRGLFRSPDWAGGSMG